MSTHKNKTVLITRSEEQAKPFLEKLSNLGFRIILFPLIEIKAINSNQLIAQFNQLNYDWIIFTSTNAVKYFFQLISPKLISCKIAVVGDKTKMAIKNLGLRVDFTPSKYTSKNLGEEISIKNNDTILIPRSAIAKDNMLESLRVKGASVYPISIYKNSPINYSIKEIETIFSQKIDYITFTSSSIVKAFSLLKIKLNKEKVICIGPETAKTTKKLKINVFRIAEPHNIEGMIKIINATYN